MLDIGFSELLLIAVAALVFVGPKDLPVVIRAVAKFAREVRSFYLGAKKHMVQLADEAGLSDIHQEMTTIIDLEGKPQQAYKVEELSVLAAPPKREWQ